MNGQIGGHTSLELVREISAHGLSGALRLSRERVRGVVYFDNGSVTAAMTNVRGHRIAEVLKRTSPSLSERMDKIVAPGMNDDQAGAALVSEGLIDQQGLRRLRHQQSVEALKYLLGWEAGEWAFDPRVRLGGEARGEIKLGQFLLEASRSLSPELSSRRIADDEMLSPAEDSLTAAEGLQLLPGEGYLLSRVDAPVSLAELVAVSGLPEDEVRRTVYALVVVGLLKRESWPRVFTPEALARSIKSQPAERTKSNPPATVVAPPPEQAAVPAEPPPPEPADPRKEMEELFERASAPTHYSVLGVGSRAEASEIKRVYYALAKRFHPDRFRQVATSDELQKVESSFARVAQAYEVLKDSKARASYDLKIGPQFGASAPPPPSGKPDVPEPAPVEKPAGEKRNENDTAFRAEEKFQQGLTAFQQNNLVLATKYFAEAALLVPKQARYRAFYGRALTRDKQRRRQAEAELQAAVQLDPQNPSYHVMLAELYSELGLRRRAEGELERALSLSPQNAAARKLLDELHKK